MQLYELIAFAKEYRALSWSVQEQLEELAENPQGAELNENAVALMAYHLVPALRNVEEDVADELLALIEEWRENAHRREPT